MSSGSDSRTNSVYVDALEEPEDFVENVDGVTEAPSAMAPTVLAPTATSTAVTEQRQEEDHDSIEDDEDDDEDDIDDDDDDDEDDSSSDDGSDAVAGTSSGPYRGRSQRSPVMERDVEEGEDDDEDDEDDDEEIVMQVDPATGLQRATSLTRQPRSSSVTSRLRRQHRRMTSSTRYSSRSSASGSGSGQPSNAGSLSSATSTSAGSSRAVAVPAVDEKAQSDLRRKIMDIQRDPTISFADKAGMIQKLMTSKWQGNQRSAEKSKNDGSGNSASEDDLKTTYYSLEQQQLGCKHYRRGCKLKANCCGKWFNCRFCHDDVCDHAIVRSETKSMLCMHCKAIQPAAQNCSECKARLALYYCDICKLWDDDPRKHIYHCDDCGICRIGQGLGEDFFHCKKCNVCMNIQLQGNHKCIERNLECDCPICGEYMFTSTTTVIFMPCGHCIHSRCHEDYIKTSYQCPTCWKALGDMSAYYSKIERLLADQKMPPEYANIFSVVLCNDCEVKSEAPYHFLYHKCEKCSGYNTKVLETFKRVAEGQVEVVENATASGAAGTVPENNISGGSSVVAGSAASSSTAAAAATAVGSSSTAGSASSSSAARPSGSTASAGHRVPVNLPPRSPLRDENASGDTSMMGMSGNS